MRPVQKWSTKTSPIFSYLQRNVFKTLNEKEVKEWMVERFSIISKPVMASLNLVQDSDRSDDDQDTLKYFFLCLSKNILMKYLNTIMKQNNDIFSKRMNLVWCHIVHTCIF